MDTAFETETKKIVKAWVIGKDTSYIMPEKDIFMTNPDEIVNYEETLKKIDEDFIEARYRRGHLRTLKNGKNTTVVPHFFIPNKEKKGIETLPESPEHKKIKSFMYDYFFNNTINKIKYSKYIQKSNTIEQEISLNDLDIEWEKFTLKKEDFFEVNIVDTFNTRRVDLFLPFKKYNSLFGHGLVIEVQLSNQTPEKIKERTIDRALKGYSTLWIMKKDFIDYKAENLEIKELPCINSYHSVLHNNSDNIADEIYNKIKKYSREFDEKIKELQESIVIQDGMLCPVCKTGQLVTKKGIKGDFLGCSNYLYGCKASYNITKKTGVLENE